MNLLKKNKEGLSSSLNLVKTQASPNGSKYIAGAGWDMMDPPVDCDLSVMVLGSDGKMLSEDSFAYFNQTEIPGVRLSEDDVDGSNSDGGDDENAVINLDFLEDGATAMILSVTVYNDPQSRDLADVPGCYVRIVDAETMEEIVRVELGQIQHPGMMALRIDVSDEEVKFTAIEEGTDGMDSMLKAYAK